MASGRGAGGQGGLARRTRRQVKCLVLGGAGCGKTSMVKRIATGDFDADEAEPSTGASLYLHACTSPAGEPLHMALWDCAGSEKLLPVIQTTVGLDDADAVILVFSVDNADSLADAQFWRNEVVRESRRRGVTLMLVGNKSDLRSRVGPSGTTPVRDEQLLKQAKEWGAGHAVVSAATGEGVVEMLAALVRRATSSGADDDDDDDDDGAGGESESKGTAM